MIGVLDAGTGIRNLGHDIMQRKLRHKYITIAFSHFHWDHIQGLPFFEPAYSKEFKIQLMALGLGRKVQNLEKVFEDQMREEYFPVELKKMGALFRFMLADKSTTEILGAEMSTCKLKHPGGSYGYKLTYNGKTIVICTDVEHGDSIDQNVVDFASGADVLIHDAQYTDEELERHRGWGHSTFNQALDVAEQSGVERLIMTHHDPDHDDQFLTKMEKVCQDRMKNCSLAREGMLIEV